MKIKKSEIVICFLLIPFFELYSISILINTSNYPFLFLIIDRILAFSRWSITMWIVLTRLSCRSKVSNITILSCCFAMMRIISSMLNRSFSLNVAVGSATYIGFTLLVENIINKDEDEFVEANLLLFGILSIVGVLQIIMFPNGYYNSDTKAQAVYFFGSKNSGFYYYFFFFYFNFLKHLKENKPIKWNNGFFFFLFTIAAIICDSKNTLICLLLLLCYFIIEISRMKYYLFSTSKCLSTLICVFSFFLLEGKKIPFVGSILKKIGRDDSFTGRDYIWEKVLGNLKYSIVWGSGPNMDIMLLNGTSASHAHNFFLDIWAKYGLFTFSFLFFMLACISVKIDTFKSRNVKLFYSVFLFVLLLHSLMDDISIYMVLLFIICTDKINISSRCHLYQLNV